jgi:hypothetical protein
LTDLCSLSNLSSAIVFSLQSFTATIIHNPFASKRNLPALPHLQAAPAIRYQPSAGA